MKKTVLLVGLVTAGAFASLAQSASADPDIMCKLEQMGVYHSPISSACHDDPWED